MHFDRFLPRLPQGFSMPALSSFALPGAIDAQGRVPLLYKGVVVTIMALVACGTVVSFGTADAQTVPSASSAANIPAGNEVSPTVEGQPLQPIGLDPSLFSSSPLLDTVNLSGDGESIGAASDDDDDDQSKSDKKLKKIKKQAQQGAKAAGSRPPAGQQAAAETPKAGDSPKPPASDPPKSDPPPSNPPPSDPPKDPPKSDPPPPPKTCVAGVCL